MKLLLALLLVCVISQGTVGSIVNSLYSISLDGDQEVPPSGSGNTGQGTFALDKDTDILSFTITHNLGAAALAAHIHGPAAAGENGDVLFAFESATSPITGEWEINNLIAEDLLKDHLYVNIHTEDNPTGEIRGQILLTSLEGVAIAEARLSGDKQVPPVDSDFTGRADFEFSNFTGILKYEIKHNVDAPTMVHIHQGAEDANGPVRVTLGVAADGDDLTKTIKGEVEINAATEALLLGDQLYLNIHTEGNPDGEIRGQIIVTDFFIAFDDSDSEDDSDGLSGGAIFGIVFTVLLIVGAAATAGLYWYQKKRRGTVQKDVGAGGYLRQQNDTALLDDAQEVEPSAYGQQLP